MKAVDSKPGQFYIFGDQCVVIRTSDAVIVAEGTEKECRAEATRRAKQDKEDYAVFAPKAIYGRKREVAVEEVAGATA